MMIKGSIDGLLKDWATTAMTDPWPTRVRTVKVDRLTFTALVRCACGAGMAHDAAWDRAWGCSDILTGKSEPGPEHSELYPFFAWKFKSENAEQTTRPTP